jgi:hypothetical protein
MSMLSKIRESSIVRFLTGFAGVGKEAPMLIENPTEEIDEALARGKDLRIHFASLAQRRGVAALAALSSTRGDIRGEENYLFSSRRYPAAVDNVLPAGNSIPQGQYQYFNYAVNANASSGGFPTAFTASYNETNLTVANQTPAGQGFRIFREGIGFNTEAKAEDIEQVLDSGDFQYTTEANQYSLFKGPLAAWPGGIGVSGFSTNQNTEAAHNGIADLRSVRTTHIPRIIPPLKQFGYVHNVGVTGRATNGSVWQLSDFVIARVLLWGDQLTKQTS